MTPAPEESLEAPPRPVPLMGRTQLLFGGAVAQLGWFFFGFGMLFFWLFSVPENIQSLLAFSGTLEQAPGKILSSHRTSSEENEEYIYANKYSFTLPGGRTLKGVSYTVGRGAKAGAQVMVEYKKSNPRRSRVRGMRAQPFGPFVLFVVMFPLIGLIMAMLGFRKGLKASHLLSHGVLALGELVEKRATNTEINERTVYALTFAFEADNGRTYEVVEKTHKPELLEDEEFERLMYDPQNPTNAVMLDSLPGGPEITHKGRYDFPFLRGLLVLIVPVGTVVINGMVLMYKFGFH